LQNFNNIGYERVTKLFAYKSSTPSRWREKAMERQANKEWLRYSQKIAMMMLDKMDELGITQKALPSAWAVHNNTYPVFLKARRI